jgi:divalent metal cation (Fe/Co/Zn/Cd) transporter
MATCSDKNPATAHVEGPIQGQAFFLVGLTIVVNLLEGLAAVHYGTADGSVALWGFGFDSFIEVGSALVVLWRLAGGAGAKGRQRERRATNLIGNLFLFLALGIALGSWASLSGHRAPTTTLPGVVIAALSITAMAILWRWKLRVAHALDSAALANDAACSRACMQLGSILLLGSLASWLFRGLGWLDACAALILALLVAREGLAMVRASRRKDFSGGCGCH